ncbi:MAG TPA: cellulose synthase family protein [Thermoanaerobaculia bacterium]|nr:cellulose synthase family protein [Thermoanaerobaculia bacterium]
MSFSGAPALLALYYLVLGVLAFFGMHRFYLVVWYLCTRNRRPEAPPDPAQWPVVTVQLPLYNEVYVAQRLIESVCALDYPEGRLEIQILDDSTDETSEIVAGVVAEQRARGIDVVHLHRTDRTGFKAGALEAGLHQARGTLIAVFDADFVPDPDFLRKSVPWFVAPDLALVQGRWAHINRPYSLLTRVQAILLDGHFFIEHSARNRSGCFFNFNGTAGIWRRAAIEDAGGWEHDTLTEDLDLSYRAQLRGWRFLYLPDLAVPSELPVDINGFKNQQYRWAKGSIQTGRKLLGQVIRTKLPWRVKMEALIHLTNNFSYALMVLLAVLVFPAMLLQKTTTLTRVLTVDIPLFFGATVSVLVFYLASQAAGGLDWKKQLRYLPTLMGVGLGLSINNAIAVLSGFFKMGGTFHRTPKYRIEKKGEDWLGKRYRSGKNLAFPIEVAFALYFSCCTVYALAKGMWPSVPFLALFVYGYSYMAFLSMIPALENLRVRWSRRAGGPSPPAPLPQAGEG